MKDNLIIPDEAISFIVRNYLMRQHTEGLQVSLGVNQHTVEAVLELFIAWAKASKRIENNSIVLGE